MKIFFRRTLLRCFLAAAVLAVLPGCGEGEKATSNGGSSGLPTVVATTSMIADMASAIAGDSAEVIGLMGPGVDPHDYSPGASDVASLRSADVVFYNGLMLEGKMAELFDKLSDSGKSVHALGKVFSNDELIHPDDSDHHDPHIWGDAGMWARCVPVVTAAIADLIPADAEAIQQRGAALQKSYQELDAWAKERLATIPKDQRFLMTSHDAFSYFGRAYDIQVIGIQGISTSSEAGIGDIVKAVDFIKDNGIRAIFVETSTNRKAIDRISADSGAKVGGELFSDAMGEPGDMIEIDGVQFDKGTYPGMLKFNVDTVVRALSGE